MNLSLARCALVATLLPLCSAGSAPAAEMKAELDCSANTKLLDSHFARYGFQMPRTIIRELKGMRFRLPGAYKGAHQDAGMYSYFQLAGDFEFTVTYEILNMPTPLAGYGVSCGIAAESKDRSLEVSLSRGQHVKQGICYEVTKRTKDEAGKPKWDGVGQFATLAKSGRLVLRREKNELICLASDNLKDEPKELTRLPFPEMTVRTVRLYADTGGSPTPVDVRITKVLAKAEEITGGIPARDMPGGAWLWWLIVLTFVGILVYAYYRRWRDNREDDEPPSRTIRRPIRPSSTAIRRAPGKSR